MIFAVRLALSLIFVACVTALPLPRSPVADQVLTVRPGGDPVLSNRIMVVCGEKGKERCPELARYDLRDDKTRAMLFQFKFVCKIAGRLYKVCPDKPGFCRSEYKGLKWPWSKPKLTYLDIEKDYDLLVGARTTCVSKDKRGIDELD